MRPIAGVLFGCMLAACAESADKPGPDTTALPPHVDSAVAAVIGDEVEDTIPRNGEPQPRATMRDAAGQELGMLTLSETGNGVTLEGRLTGLPPGEHGFHVHAVGRCEGPAFQSAGPHWNPGNRQHGESNPQGPHAGDLLNLTVPGNGIVDVSVSTHGGTLAALLDADGAAVVIHADPDDYRTDPSGNSGDRIACGVVERG